MELVTTDNASLGESFTVPSLDNFVAAANSPKAPGRPSGLFGKVIKNGLWRKVPGHLEDTFIPDAWFHGIERSCLRNVAVWRSPTLFAEKLNTLGRGGPLEEAKYARLLVLNRWKKMTDLLYPTSKGKEVGVNLNYGGKKPVALPCLEPSTVMKKSIDPLVNEGSCTGLDVLGGGPSKVKNGLGRVDIGPSKEVSNCPGPGKTFIENVGDNDVILGGPGRDDALRGNWAVGPINLVGPNLEKGLINKEWGSQ
uniref:Uncharacterized protein n=1 Tax=Cannabis sativa TaxID=3483 RepID=A0A803P0X0_CANSA